MLRCGELAAMHFPRVARAVALVTIGSSIACSATPSAPTSTVTGASVVITILTATVEPLTTTPQPGLLYRVTYRVHETGGRSGVTLVQQHFALSDGTAADGTFSAALMPPHVAPAGTITVESTLSIYPTTTPASHVTFSVTYTEDGGKSGTASAEADISRTGANSLQSHTEAASTRANGQTPVNESDRRVSRGRRWTSEAPSLARLRSPVPQSRTADGTSILRSDTTSGTWGLVSFPA
jgi:hypothetical protein